MKVSTKASPSQILFNVFKRQANVWLAAVALRFSRVTIMSRMALYKDLDEMGDKILDGVLFSIARLESTSADVAQIYNSRCTITGNAFEGY